MSIIEQVYREEKYFLACVKIAGQDADDLYQHVNLMILERENKGNLNFEGRSTFYTYYYRIAWNEYTDKSHSFYRIHTGKVRTETIDRNAVMYSVNSEDGAYMFTELIRDKIYNSNNFLTLVDDFARTPHKDKDEMFVKELYLECTKPNFIGVTDLSIRTGINKMTIYGALKRFTKLYDDYSNSV